MTAVERALKPRGHYSLRLTAMSRDATRRWEDDAYTAAVRVGDCVELASARHLRDGTVLVRATSDDAVEALQFQLALDDDHAEFLQRFRRDPLIGQATRELDGMRQARVGSVAQALLRAFCGQLIESRRARAIEGAIVRASTASSLVARTSTVPSRRCRAEASSTRSPTRTAAV